MKLALPAQSDNFYAFCAKKSQVIIVYERGYDIPEEEAIIFLQTDPTKIPSEKAQFETFLQHYKPEDEDLVNYLNLDQNYIGEDLIKLKVRFCMGSELGNRVTEEITLKKNVRNRKNMKRMAAAEKAKKKKASGKSQDKFTFY